MQPEHLLGEIEAIIRDTPSKTAFEQQEPQCIEWGGRAVSAINEWNMVFLIPADQASQDLVSDNNYRLTTAVTRIQGLLQQAKASLRMRVGPVSRVFEKGQVHGYFEQVRQIITQAQKDVFFVDPYLDAEFVDRYVRPIRSTAEVRLLTSNSVPDVVNAAKLLTQEAKIRIHVRSSKTLHDRWVFVDRTQCYLSGGSFKDGARGSSTVLVQVLDAFAPLAQLWESAWTGAQVAL